MNGTTIACGHCSRPISRAYADRLATFYVDQLRGHFNRYACCLSCYRALDSTSHLATAKENRKGLN